MRTSLTVTAGAVATVTALAILLAYFLTAYHYETARIHHSADMAAVEVSKFIYTRPNTWMYQNERLEELLDTVAMHTKIPASSPASSSMGEHDFGLRFLDTKGNVIIEMGMMTMPLSITARSAVSDGFETVGVIELTESVRHIWLHAFPAILIGLALAFAIFATLKVLPLRALLRREAALEAARQENYENEMQLRLVSDAMPVLIGYIDSDNRVRVMNRIGEEWYARSRDEIIGRHIGDILPRALSSQLRPYMTEALSGIAVNFEETGTYPDGVTRQIRGRYFPHLGPEGQTHGYFVLVEDVTAQRETEIKLRQAQKAEAMGQLTGGIAHDFNNLLGIILGNVELLRDHIGHDPMAMQLNDAALNACLRGGELTQRLLSFSRIQTLKPRITKINDLIANTTVLLRRTLDSSIQIDTVLADDLWLCPVDAGQLENAIVNLCINARDAMPDGGKLTIETANTAIDGDPGHPDIESLAPGPYIVITVTDSGMGMAPEVAARAFEPFFTTKDVGKGSGLGLSMVFGFAKQSGGQAKIYSEPGEGTTVRLYLPKAQAKENTPAADQADTAEMPAGNGETILVVEDAEDLRQVAVAHLQSLGYTVLQAGDGLSALTLLKERSDIDLLFTDLILPDGLNGGELARRATARRPDLKVLYTSGYARNALVQQGRLEEGVHLIDKPYRKQDLARHVREALDDLAERRASA